MNIFNELRHKSWEVWIFWFLTVTCYFISIFTFYHSFYFLFQHDITETAEVHSSGWLLNFLLICMFICQHSVMASSKFKGIIWKNRDFQHLERSTYVLSTCLFLEVLMKYWTIFPNWIVWSVDPIHHDFMLYISIFGWILLFIETIIFDHFELFGAKHVWNFTLSEQQPMLQKNQQKQKLYKNYRHPMFIGQLIITWNTPVMTLDKFLLVLLLSIYPLIPNKMDQEDVSFVEKSLLEYGENIIQNRPRLAGKMIISQ